MDRYRRVDRFLTDNEKKMVNSCATYTEIMTAIVSAIDEMRTSHIPIFRLEGARRLCDIVDGMRYNLVYVPGDVRDRIATHASALEGEFDTRLPDEGTLLELESEVFSVVVLLSEFTVWARAEIDSLSQTRYGETGKGDEL